MTYDLYDVDHRYQGSWHQERVEFDSPTQAIAHAQAFADNRNSTIQVKDEDGDTIQYVSPVNPSPDYMQNRMR